MIIRLCGRFAVEHDGESLQDKLSGRQGRLLLAYLALRGRSGATRDELIDALWEKDPPVDPDAALSTLLSRLRTVLPKGTIEGRRELSLRMSSGDELDVQRAEAAIRRAHAAATDSDWVAGEESARVALEIASAPLLPGHDARWLDEHRRHLGGITVEALELCARAGVRRDGGDLAAAEAAAREVVEQEPYRESAYVCLMEAQSRRGNVAEALRTYESLRTLLREELGTIPGPEVKALHGQLLRGDAGGAGEDAEIPGAVTTTSKPSRPKPAPLPALIARLGYQPLVGRRAELERIGALWQEAIDGQQQRILFVAGEPGVGKSSIAAHFACAAHPRGAMVLYGRAEAEALISYQPFVEAIRHLALNGPLATLRAVAPELAELSRLVPEFRRRLPELPPPLEQGAGDDRYRLFSAAAALLTQAARNVPLLLVLDDLHWADRSSLRLLCHIARYSDPAPLLILGTYRDTELDRSAALAETLVDLRREHLDERLRVVGLDEEAVGQLVASTTDSAPRGLPELIHQETRGNPFFLVEMLRQLADADAFRPDAEAVDARALLVRVDIPEGVQQVIERRFDALSERAREALTLAAVLGQEFELDVLAAVAGTPTGDLETPLEEALDARLLTELHGDPGRLAFSHAVVRETIYRRPSALRRSRLHHRAGETLEGFFSEGLEANAAELARHFLAAGSRGDRDKAIRYSVTAAEQATRRFAYEEAADHYVRAIERSEPGILHCELLLELGKARFRSADAEARAAFRSAAEEARLLHAETLFAHAALGLSGRRAPLAGGQVDGEAVSLLEEALDRLPAGDSVLRAAVLGQLAAELYWSPDVSRRDALSREALTVARRTGDAAAVAEALFARRFAVWGPDSLEERLRIGEEILRLADETGDRKLTRAGQHWRVADLLEAGELEAARAEIAAETRSAEALRQPLRLWVATIFRAMLALFEGRLDAAERLASDAYALGRRGDQADAPHGLAAQLAFIRRDQGRGGEIMETARAYTERGATARPWRCWVAVMSAELGQEADARNELERWRAHGFEDIPRDVDWLFSLAHLAEVSAYVGDADASAALYKLLLPYSDRCVLTAYAAVCSGSVARYLALLATTLGHYDEAVRHFEQAIERHTRWRARPWLARTRHSYAEMLISRGEARDLAAARDLLEEALGTAREIGMRGLVRDVDKVLAATRASLGSGGGQPLNPT